MTMKAKNGVNVYTLRTCCVETFKKPSHLIYVKNYIGLKITCMVLLKSGKSFVRKMRVGSLSRKSPFFGV